MEKNDKKKHFFLGVKVLALIMFLMGVVYLTSQAGGNEMVTEFVASFGYGGLFLASIVSGFNVIFPLPIATFVPLLVESGFSFWISVAVITLGMTVGDGVGLLIGIYGKKFSKESLELPEWLDKVQTFFLKYRYGAFFFLFLYAAFAPAPNELVVIPLAFLGVKPRTIIFAMLLGNTVFNILTALSLSGVLSLV